MVFTDAYERTIDAKNRIQIPAEFRRGIDPEADESFYLCPGERHNTLALYPEQTFQARAARIRTEDVPGDDSLAFEQLYYGMASRLEMDKQGRVVLPERQLSFVDLGKDITLVGASSRIEIWRTTEYAEFLRANFGTRWKELQKFLRQSPASQAGAESKP